MKNTTMRLIVQLILFLCPCKIFSLSGAQIFGQIIDSRRFSDIGCIAVASASLLTDDTMNKLTNVSRSQSLQVSDIKDGEKSSCISLSDGDSILALVKISNKSILEGTQIIELAFTVDEYTIFVITSEALVFELWSPKSIATRTKQNQLNEIFHGPLYDVDIIGLILEGGFNLHGEEITASFEDWAPFVMADLETGVVHGGIFPDVFEVLGTMLNFTPRYIKYCIESITE